MKRKIAVFYLIGQFREWWKDQFYIPQMEALISSGLYDEIEFLDIHISGGREPLPFIPNKTRSITYQNNPGHEERELMKSIHRFAIENYEYKILHFHSEGVTRNEESEIERKMFWRHLMEHCNIHLWKECLELLNFYDCVGADYIHQATFNDPKCIFKAPHFPGMFWWTNASYFRTLDREFLDQKLPWSRFLAELWIGTKNPTVYKMHHFPQNYPKLNLDLELRDIQRNVNSHLDLLKIETREPLSLIPG